MGADMRDNDVSFYRSGVRETLATLGLSTLTLLVLVAAGYYAPDLLAAALH